MKKALIPVWYQCFLLFGEWGMVVIATVPYIVFVSAPYAAFGYA